VVPTVAIIFALGLPREIPPFFRVQNRMNGFAHLTIMGI
jgi:hypothetical protein